MMRLTVIRYWRALLRHQQKRNSQHAIESEIFMLQISVNAPEFLS
jgi:hypothetical protein